MYNWPTPTQFLGIVGLIGVGCLLAGQGRIEWFTLLACVAYPVYTLVYYIQKRKGSMEADMTRAFSIAVISIFVMIALYILWLIGDIPIFQLTTDGLTEAEAKKLKDTLGLTSQFGDSFGMLTSIFSGLAFSGVCMAIFIQRKEITMVKSEMAQQRFESVFFQMLSLYMDTLKTIKASAVKNTIQYQGEEAILVLATLQGSPQVYIEEIKLEESETNQKDVSSAFKKIIKGSGIDRLHSHYFSILRFISINNLLNKMDYYKILSTYVSKETRMLFYYQSLDADGIQQLVDEFGIFDDLTKKDLFREFHRDFSGFSVINE